MSLPMSCVVRVPSDSSLPSPRLSPLQTTVSQKSHKPPSLIHSNPLEVAAVVLMGDPSTTKSQPFHVGSSVGNGVSTGKPAKHDRQLTTDIRYSPVRNPKDANVFRTKQSLSVTLVILSAKLGVMI